MESFLTVLIFIAKTFCILVAGTFIGRSFYVAMNLSDMFRSYADPGKARAKEIVLGSARIGIAAVLIYWVIIS